MTMTHAAGSGSRATYATARLRRADRPLSVRRWHAWDAVSFGLLAAYAAGLTMLVMASASPSLLSRFPAVFDVYRDPSSPIPIAVQALLGTAALVTFWLPRRHQNRKYSLVAVVGLGVTAIILGMSAYWNCAGGQSRPWAPITWTLALFLGNAENPYGVDQNCPDEVPLALQAARLAALAATSIGVVGAVSLLFRDQIDRLRVRYSRSIVLVTGIDDFSHKLLSRIRASHSKSRIAVLFNHDDPHFRTVLRRAGIAVVTTRIESANDVRPLLMHRHRLVLRALYALAPDPTVNFRLLSTVRAATAAAVTHPPLLAHRVVVRIDNPWQAESWRRQNIQLRGLGLLDALSVHESTGSMVLDNVLADGADRLILVVESLLGLAMLAELAQREREAHASRGAEELRVPTVVLVGEHSHALAAQHLLRQARFGNTDRVFTPVARDAIADERSLEDAASGSRSVAVVLGGEKLAGDIGFASALAVRHPSWLILALQPDAREITRDPVLERLYQFGPVLGPQGTAPIDSWERVARIAHKNFLHDYGADPSDPARREWDAGLPDFYKETNIRLITTTLSSALALGRTWDSADPKGDDLASFSDDEIHRMAEAEHESWVAHHVNYGWKYGAVRDEGKRLHPMLVPWSRLDEANKLKAEASVRDSLALLSALGYHSRRSDRPSGKPDSDGQDQRLGWRAFRRTGTVTATQEHAAWTWNTEGGDALSAQAGDWRVTDEDGTEWSVAPDEFTRTYEHVGAAIYRRSGVVHARPGTPGESVTSIEGKTIVRNGDWVVQGPSGEEWVVPDAKFTLNYIPVDKAGVSDRDPEDYR